jgi:hypothetical protein
MLSSGKVIVIPRNAQAIRGLLSVVATIVGIAAHAVTPESPDGAARNTREVVRLSPFKVSGDRLEDFGFRVSPGFDVERSTKSRRVYTPVVDVVLPNTAGAKAGVRPKRPDFEG